MSVIQAAPVVLIFPTWFLSSQVVENIFKLKDAHSSAMVTNLRASLVDALV